LQGLAGVKTVRATSMFGFSLITVIFRDDVDNYFARSRVLERLNYLSTLLPAGVTPQLGPDATGLGWIYQYYLQVDPRVAPDGGYDLGRLRAIQDWFVRYQLNAVPGVAEVASLGGFVRQYQIEVSSLKMRALGISLQEVLEAVSANNLNVGGKTVNENGMEFVIRGVGLVRGIEDLERIALKTGPDGTPILLPQVASIQLGGDFRRGALDVDGREVVGGIVVMRTGENAMAVIEAVKARIEQIRPALPAGVTVQPFYDRSDLIARTIATLKDALWEEMLLVTLAHVLFLFHFRSILIVTLPLPLSILISFLLMQEFGISSNIMSLAGIAIAIGVLVDAGIVMTENVIRHCELREAAKGGAAGPARLTAAETWDCTLAAAQQVGRPIVFAMAIIILAFAPVFVLGGQEGKLFRPLAFTKTFACVGATLLAVTLVPVLCSFLVRGPFHAEHDNRIMRVLLRLYDPALRWALDHRRTVLGLAALLLGAALLLASGLPRALRERLESAGLPAPLLAALGGMGKEFMPPLNEGSLLFMPVLLPATSLGEVNRILSWQDRTIRQIPEVASAAGKLGRADTATDPAPVEMIETTLVLKPEYLTTRRSILGLFSIPWTVRNPEWRPGVTRESLVAELTQALTAVPGYVPGFLQPIENRVLMISTGIRAQLGVKLLGDNLDALQQQAFAVQRVVESVSGAAGVAPSRVQGKPYLEVTVDRAAMARYGLDAQRVLEAVEVGIGGRNVTTTIEGRERFPIQVRLQRDERDDLERLGGILVAAPSGLQIPLGQVASIRRVLGPNEIASENGRLRVFVQANVQGRDLGSFVTEVKRRLVAEIQPHLPAGMTLEYSGQYEELLRAERTLLLVIPMSLLIIFLLLYVVYHSAGEAAHVILAVPFALSGSVFLQYALGYPFSVAVWIGYIALFGIAIQTGVVMVVYLEEALAQKRAECADRGEAFRRADLLDAIRAGARLRLRPKVMTVATTIASLLPIMWSSRAGAEVMKPLAAPVIGGSLSSLLHILIVTPVLVAWLRERELSKPRHPLG
ncbi:MAG: efflux RND transporter permease subunit, partial [Verrucomicrobiae bacterium]|nr:efflux RND transporter permease subunit [Verrucomicrobiae bacterium]